MKFAFSTLGCPDWPLEHVAARAAALGYDGVEIRGVRGEMDLSKTSEFSGEGLERTKRLFRDSCVAVVSIDASASGCWPKKAQRELAFEEAMRHVEIAAAMGSTLVRVFGGDIPEGGSREESAAILADWLGSLGEAAKPFGVAIGIETHDSWCRADELMPVVEAAGGDNVKVIWDLMHTFRYGETFAASAERFGDLVAHVHIKDYVGEPEDYELKLPGEGIMPLAEALRVLKGGGFDSYVSLEWEKMWHPEIEDPEVAFPHTIAFLRKLDAEA